MFQVLSSYPQSCCSEYRIVFSLSYYVLPKKNDYPLLPLKMRVMKLLILYNAPNILAT